MPLVDFSVVDERNFEPVPDDTYDAVFSEWQLVMPKSSDKFPYYNLTFTLLSDEYKNRKIWLIRSLSPKALWAFKRDMIRLGAPAEDMSPDSTVDTDEVVAGCVGAECRLVLKTEDYQKNDGSPGRKNVVQEVLASGLGF